MKKFVCFLSVILSSFVPIVAETITFEATLEGKQEVGPNDSAGTGQVSVTLDDASGAVTVTGSYSGLSTTAVASHIHGLAPAGVNAGVILPLTITGGTAGSISGSGTLTAAQVQGMKDGQTYANVHTTKFGGGEIRGQLHRPAAPQVPALSPWLLAALGITVFGAGSFILRKRKLATE